MTRRRPDIVMMVADDHAAHAISAYDDRLLRTPNLDRLAAEGMRFDNCFCTNSLCAPSRATILTGTYNHVNGVRTLSTLFDARQPTFASLLQAAGYRNVLVGKWHLGHGGVHDPRGFDSWEVLEDQGDYWDPEFIGPHGRRRIPGYATTVINDLALAHLRDRPDDRPLCLLVWHKAPHRPWDPDVKHADLFAGSHLPEPVTLFDDHSGQSTAAREARMQVGRDLTERDLKQPVPPGLTGDDRTRWALQRYLEDYLRCVAIVLNVDFAQTVLELAGVPPHHRMQGRSLVALLGGEAPTDWRDCAYYRYWEHDDGVHHVWAHDGIRTSTHKLVRYYANGLGLPGTSARTMTVEWELFDLRSDPHELRSVYDDPAYATVRVDLTERLHRAQAEIGDEPPPSVGSR